MTLVDSLVAPMYCLEPCKTCANYNHTSNTDSVPLLSSYTIVWQVHVHKMYTLIATVYFWNVGDWLAWLNTLRTWQGSKLPNITAKKNKKNNNYCSVNSLSTVCTPGQQQHAHYTHTVGNCNHNIGRHANCSHKEYSHKVFSAVSTYIHAGTVASEQQTDIPTTRTYKGDVTLQSQRTGDT